MSSVAHGFANSGMTDAQREALSVNDPEYYQRYVTHAIHIEDPNGSQEYQKLIPIGIHRVVGSKIQVAGWVTYMTLINTLKLSMLAFYVRLTV